MVICESCGQRYTPTAAAPTCPTCAAQKSPSSGIMRPRPASAPKPAAAAKTSRSGNPRYAEARAMPEHTIEPAPGARPRKRAPQQHADSEPLPSFRHDQMFDRTTKIGLGVAGVLAVVVCIVVVVVVKKKGVEQEQLHALDTELTILRDELASLDVGNEANANRVLQLAKEKEPRWKGHKMAAEIQTLVARAGTSLASGKERREVYSRFAEIEEALKSPASLTAERLTEMRRLLDELEPKVSLGDPELLARVSLAKTAANKALAARLVAEAKGAGQAEPGNPRLALVRSQAAEDEIRKLLDQAYHEKNEELQGFYAPLFQQAIEESDRLTTALFAAEDSGDSLPWVDCLSGEHATQWNASTAKGFSHRVASGELQIVGPDADAGRIAIVSIGDREQWRNFVADMEFTIEKGNVELYFRLGRNPTPNTLAYSLKTTGDSANVQAGRTYRAKASLLGSRFVVRFATEDIDTPEPYEETVSWVKGRKGAIGILVPAGARVRFTRFQVRELR